MEPTPDTRTAPPKRPRKPNPLLTPLGCKPEIAAQRIGQSVPTIYRLVAAGKLVMVKSGQSSLVTEESLCAYFASLPRVELRRRMPKTS